MKTDCDTHRQYTGYINARLRVAGHLWQGWFGSVAMDEEHLAHTVRYVSLNPVRARLVDRADKWQWSSVRAHLDAKHDGLVSVGPVLERFGRFDRFIDLGDTDTQAYQALRPAETTGRPVASEDWITTLETQTGRALSPQKREPKTKDDKTQLVHLVNCHRNYVKFSF